MQADQAPSSSNGLTASGLDQTGPKAEAAAENLLTEGSELLDVVPAIENRQEYQYREEVFVNNYSQVSKEANDANTLSFNQINEESNEYTTSPNILSRGISGISPPIGQIIEMSKPTKPKKSGSGTHNYQKFLLKTGYKGFKPFVPIEEKYDLRFKEI